MDLGSRMSVYQGNDLRKITGGRKRPSRKKRKYELGRFPTNTMLSDVNKRVIDRVRGGGIKVRLKRVAFANVTDPGKGVSKRVRILEIVETPDNKEHARIGIITKGAIIRTEAGIAKVTSRPGQDGVVNAVIIETAKSE